MSTRAKRREDARPQALRLRQEPQAAAERQRIVVTILVAVGLLVIGSAVAWILSNTPEPQPDFSQSKDPLSEATGPATANEEGGIPVGPAGVAGDTGGAADDAVNVTVYFDYMCPVCATFEQTNGETLRGLREAGDVVVEYRPVSILDRTSLGSQFSTRAAAAAALIADDAPEAFLAFHDAMFAQQPAEGTQGLTDEQIAEIATTAGAPDDVVAAIVDRGATSGDGSFSAWVAAATEQATRDFPPDEQGQGGFGTPTVMIDGEKLAADWRMPGALELAVEEARG